MTEEDTIRILRKQPYHILRSMINDIPDELWESYTDESLDAWFEFRGWTYKEYIIAWFEFTGWTYKEYIIACRAQKRLI